MIRACAAGIRLEAIVFRLCRIEHITRPAIANRLLFTCLLFTYLPFT